ncbi:MAG: stalk domain-containing protein [Firmicutes bacterium]|nr:stalk domain-containing protein [Bacillota bacterium]
MKKITKKQLAATLLAALLMLTPFTVSANNTDAITVTINGQEVYFPDQSPIIIDGTTLVPVRGVFETLGWEVNWNRETSTALLNRGHVHIGITIGQPFFEVLIYDPDSPFPGHGVLHMIDVPAQIIGGRTMLPLRAVLESVGYTLDWDGSTRTILISPQRRPSAFTIEDYDGLTPTALELLYVDEFGNRYYLSSIRSSNIMLTFEDGTRISLREAIDLQKVTIDELIANGLNLIIEGVDHMSEDPPAPSLTGRFIAANNAYILVLEDGSPVIMGNMSGVENLFARLQTGDKIRVTFGGYMLDSLPQQTSIYDFTLIESGSIEDIPTETYNLLAEMGWLGE